MAHRNRFSPLRSASTTLFFVVLFFVGVADSTDPIQIVCNFDNVDIETMAQLENCTEIHGDFRLTEKFQETMIRWSVKTITGCVSIRWTNLVDLDFFGNSVTVNQCSRTHEITDNQKFCLNATQQTAVHWNLRCTDKSYEECTEIVNWRTCPPVACDQSFFTGYQLDNADIATKCAIVKGDFFVNISAENEIGWISALSEVEEIHGGFTIENHIAEDLSLYFPKLRLIDLTTSQDGRISILTHDDVDLQDFDIPHLEQIKFAPATKAKFEFTIPFKSNFRFWESQKRAILMAMGPGGEFEIIGQKYEEEEKKEEAEVKTWGKIHFDAMDEQGKWVNFMTINAFFLCGVLMSFYVLCCSEYGEEDEIEESREAEKTEKGMNMEGKETAPEKEKAPEKGKKMEKGQGMEKEAGTDKATEKEKKTDKEKGKGQEKKKEK